jgi:hypothetical protein
MSVHDESKYLITKDPNTPFFLRDKVRSLLYLNIWNPVREPLMFHLFEEIHREAIEIENPDTNDVVVKSRLNIYCGEIIKKLEAPHRGPLSPSDKSKRIELVEHLKLIWFILQ